MIKPMKQWMQGKLYLQVIDIFRDSANRKETRCWMCVCVQFGCKKHESWYPIFK